METLNSSPRRITKRCIVIWLPVDFYLGLSWNHRRLLEAPSVMAHSARTKALRFECTLLLSVCLIIDFAPKQLFKAVNNS